MLGLLEGGDEGIGWGRFVRKTFAQPHVYTSLCLLLPEILGSSFRPMW